MAQRTLRPAQVFTTAFFLTVPKQSDQITTASSYKSMIGLAQLGPYDPLHHHASGNVNGCEYGECRIDDHSGAAG